MPFAYTIVESIDADDCIHLCCVFHVCPPADTFQFQELPAGSGCKVRRKIRDFERSREYHASIAEKERLHDAAVLPMLSAPSRLPVTVASPSQSSPASPPAPRAVRRPPLDGNSHAGAPPSLPSGERVALPSSPACARAVASSPGSPLIHCSQYRPMQHAEEKAGRRKVVDWLAVASGSRPGHPRRVSPSQIPAVPATGIVNGIDHNGELLAHLDSAGRAPLCYCATGLKEGGARA